MQILFAGLLLTSEVISA